MRVLLAGVLLAATAGAGQITSSSLNVFLDPGQIIHAYDVTPPHAAWTASIPGAEWVSISPCSGADHWTAQNCLIANETQYSFYVSFLGIGPVSITVAADDTANVYFDNVPVFQSVQFGQNLDGRPHCADAPGDIMCDDLRTISFNTIAAMHTARFDVWQGGRAAYGLEFRIDFADVPEPSAGVLIASGLLIGIAVLPILRRRGFLGTAV